MFNKESGYIGDIKPAKFHPGLSLKDFPAAVWTSCYRLQNCNCVINPKVQHFKQWQVCTVWTCTKWKKLSVCVIVVHCEGICRRYSSNWYAYTSIYGCIWNTIPDVIITDTHRQLLYTLTWSIYHHLVHDNVLFASTFWFFEFDKKKYNLWKVYRTNQMQRCFIKVST